jgi:hypothetical protein
MENFNLKKYLAEGKLLKEHLIKTGRYKDFIKPNKMKKSELRKIIKEEISRVFEEKPIGGVTAIRVNGSVGDEDTPTDVFVKTIGDSFFKGKYINERRKQPGVDMMGNYAIFTFKLDEITPEFEKLISSIRSTRIEDEIIKVRKSGMEKIFKPLIKYYMPSSEGDGEWGLSNFI